MKRDLLPIRMALLDALWGPHMFFLLAAYIGIALLNPANSFAFLGALFGAVIGSVVMALNHFFVADLTIDKPKQQLQLQGLRTSFS